MGRDDAEALVTLSVTISLVLVALLEFVLCNCDSVLDQSHHRLCLTTATTISSTYHTLTRVDSRDE